METNKKLCIVGGTGRNIGKTEFCCRLIKKIAQQTTVYGLKVSAVLPDESIWHGNHSNISKNLFEETRYDSSKDSSRMLRAGAQRVFYLQGDDKAIAEGYAHFTTHIPAGSIVICESNSLANIILPGLLLVVKATTGPIKPRSRPLLERADLVISSDGTSGFSELDRVSLDADGNWLLQ